MTCEFLTTLLQLAGCGEQVNSNPVFYTSSHSCGSITRHEFVDLGPLEHKFDIKRMRMFISTNDVNPVLHYHIVSGLGHLCRVTMFVDNKIFLLLLWKPELEPHSLMISLLHKEYKSQWQRLQHIACLPDAKPKAQWSWYDPRTREFSTTFHDDVRLLLELEASYFISLAHVSSTHHHLRRLSELNRKPMPLHLTI